MTLSAVVHLVLHVLVPGAVAGIAFRPRWARAWLLMLATLLVDVDHLLADPVYDPQRCSIGFHPLHRAPVIALYVLLVFPPRTRVVGVGLVIHMALDLADCAFQGNL